jgi:hypothetical protein
MMGRGPDGNWNWRGTVSGLQKLTPTGKTVFEMHSISITPDGFVVRFTKPVDAEWLADPMHYELTTYTYQPTHDYGGPRSTSIVSRSRPRRWHPMGVRSASSCRA